MKQFYDPEEYFLVADLSTRKLYLVHTIYRLLYKHNRPTDEIPCYLYEGQGVIVKENRELILRKKLQNATEILPKEKQQTDTVKVMPKPTMQVEYMYANI